MEEAFPFLLCGIVDRRRTLNGNARNGKEREGASEPDRRVGSGQWAVLLASRCRRGGEWMDGLSISD